MESWYTKLFSMTLVKVKMHLEGLNGWNEIVKPKKLKVIVWQRKLESHLTFFSKPNKTCNYQYCKWWLYIISNQPQQPAVQINLILATHFGDGTDLRRSPQVNLAHLWVNFWAYLYRGEGNVYFENLLLGLFPSLYGKIIQWIPKTLFAYLWLLLLSLGWASTFNRHFLHMLPTVVTALCYFGWLWLRQQSMFPSMHYRLRSIEGGQFRLVNFASHFIRVQIFQIDFPLILYL